MREQLIQYVKLLFAGTPDSEEMQQEILQNTLDRYDDLISQGKTPEAAYRLAISGIGDVSEMMGQNEPAPCPLPARPTEQDEKNKKMKAVAIGLYICCVIPLFALGSVGDGVLGLCLMFIMIAAATVLMVMSSDDKEAQEKEEKKPQTPLEKTLNTLALVVFLVLSFATGAWYITWLIFPIMVCVKGIVRACRDLRGGSAV